MKRYTRGPATAASVLAIPTISTIVARTYPTNAARRPSVIPSDRRTTAIAMTPTCPQAPKPHNEVGSAFTATCIPAGRHQRVESIDSAERLQRLRFRAGAARDSHPVRSKDAANDSGPVRSVTTDTETSLGQPFWHGRESLVVEYRTSNREPRHASCSGASDGVAG
jgi:hypothetical protein